MTEIKTRDVFIDHLRAIAITEVLIVHVLYWGDFLNSKFDIIKSFFLFEIPLFFFVIGAASTMKPIISRKKYVEQKMSKMLIFYWIYASTAVLFSTIAYFMQNETPNATDIFYMIISWLIPNGYQISYVAYLPRSTWFILFYLVIVFLIPFLQIFKEKHPLLTGFLLFIGILFSNILNLDYMRHIFTYATWTYIGFFHKEIRTALHKAKWKHLATIFSIGIFIVLLILSNLGISLDMSINQLPPNLIFFCYTIAIITIILLQEKHINAIFDWIKKFKIGNMIVTRYEQHSMTIFLYHAYICLFTIPLTRIVLTDNIIINILQCLICFILTFIGSTFISYAFQEIEKIIDNKKSFSA